MILIDYLGRIELKYTDHLQALERFCFDCKELVAASIKWKTSVCHFCKSPTTYFKQPFPEERFVCLGCQVVYPMDDIRCRFDPKHDTALKGIWCNHCFSQNVDQQKRDPMRDQIRRLMPDPDVSVIKAASQERDYLRGLNKPRRKWRREHFERRAEECLGKSKTEELLFLNVLDLGDWKGRWLPQIVLLDAYIVDFYCAELNVAIEVDGREHLKDPQLFSDQVRDQHLSLEGTRVLRLFDDGRWSQHEPELAKRTREHIEDFLRAG